MSDLIARRFHSIGVTDGVVMVRTVNKSGRIISTPLDANDLITIIEHASRELRDLICCEGNTR